MTGLDSVQLQKAIVHKVGNAGRGQGVQLSQNCLTLNDPLVKSMLIKYFMGAINENEHWQFTHLSNINLNEIFNYVSELFEKPESFIETSTLIAGFLHSKSTHARVKDGELYIAHFDQVPLGKEYVQAVGIFKSESKESFLKVFSHGQSLEVISDEGINIDKPDKGCLVFKTQKSEGYRVCIIDHTNRQNEAQYWVNDFLQVQPVADSYNSTNNYLGLCKQFITNEYAEKFETTKSDQIDLMNKSMEYFKTKDQFLFDEFAAEVIHHPEVIDTFKEFKKTFETVKNYELDDEFNIHLSAVKNQAKSFKSILKLDKNFHIYIHGRKDLLERGYDEKTGKHFYKIYFDEET